MDYTKESILDVKKLIKALVTTQKTIKPQRKTVHFTGERTLNSREATWRHSENRSTLRHLYLAYGIMRGKTADEIEPRRKTQYNPNLVEQFLTKYGEALRTSA